MEKIRVIIKRPDENYGHVTHISPDLGNLQRTLGGYVERVPLGLNSAILVNEEGKLMGLPHNFTIRMASGLPTNVIVGTAIVAGLNDDRTDLADLKMEFSAWKRLLIGWGN